MSTYVNAAPAGYRDPALVYPDDPDALLQHATEFVSPAIDLSEEELIEAEMIERRLARARLKHFVARFTPDFIPGWHIDEITAACEEIEQKIQRKRGTDARLILEAPPRLAKSQTTSRCFPLWYLGRHPKHEVIVATYGQDLADDLGRWAKACFKDPAFKALFPELHLRKDSQAANRLDTTDGGGLRYVGVGAALTGRGGSLIVCIAEGQRVTTKRGPVPIEDVRVGDEVLTHERRWRKVTKAVCNGVRPVVRVYAGGHSFVCTPEHRVYTPNGWQEAAEAENVYGYEGLPGLRFDDDRQTLQARETTNVLERLSGEVRPADLTQAEAGVYHVSNMPAGVPSVEPHGSLLLEGVQGSGACGADERREQPQLQGRDVAGALHAGVHQDERSDAPGGEVPGVPSERGFGGASSGRDEEQRRRIQSRRLVPWVPYGVSQVERCEEARVYDLSVEEDRSFVCEGFVVHNCDDLVKDAEAADSEAISEATWAWYTSVLRTRLAPGGGIVVMHTRWRVNDPIGRLLKHAEAGGEQYKRLSFPAINEDDDVNEWGMQPNETLHPERFSLEDMRATKRALPPRDWRALYMQKPMADEGNIFKIDEFDLYPAHQVPKRGIYWAVAADLAYSTSDSADHTCIWPFGLDHEDVMWFHPDFTRERMTADRSIERILDYAHELNAQYIIMEGGQGWRAIEPEFKRRMRLRGRYFTILTPPSMKDKYTRSRPLHARMQAGMCRWPDTQKFKHLAMPEFVVFTGKNDDEDDMVDTCSLAGGAVQDMVRPYDSDVNDMEDEEDIDDWSMAGIERRTLKDVEKNRKHVPPPLRGGVRGAGKRYHERS